MKQTKEKREGIRSQTALTCTLRLLFEHRAVKDLRGMSVRLWCDGLSDRSFMVDPIELYLVPDSTPRLV